MAMKLQRTYIFVILYTCHKIRAHFYLPTLRRSIHGLNRPSLQEKYHCVVNMLSSWQYFNFQF